MGEGVLLGVLAVGVVWWWVIVALDVVWWWAVFAIGMGGWWLAVVTVHGDIGGPWVGFVGGQVCCWWGVRMVHEHCVWVLVVGRICSWWGMVMGVRPRLGSLVVCSHSTLAADGGGCSFALVCGALLHACVCCWWWVLAPICVT